MNNNVLDLLPSQDGNRIKQGDQSVIRYTLTDRNNDNLELNHKQAVAYLCMGKDIAYKYVTTINNNVVDILINKIIPPGRYVLEIIVDNKYIFPSDNKKKIEVTPSVIGHGITEFESENLYAEMIRYGVENELIQLGNSIEINKNEPEDKTKIWVVPMEDE